VTATPIPFVHLGARSELSLGESIARVDELCWEAARDEQGYLALTDVNSLGRAPAFAAAAARAGLRPLFGAEIGVLPCGEAVYRGTTYRARLLVESERGWRTLAKLVNRGRSAETPTRPPHVTFADLFEDPRGLVYLLGGERGEITRLIRDGEIEKLETLLGALAESIGRERVYLELPDPVGDGAPVARMLDVVAAHFGLGTVAIPEVACAHAADDAVFRFFSGSASAGRGPDARLVDLMRPVGERRHLLPRSLAGERFAAFPGALQNTLSIAQRCAGFALPQPERRFPQGNFGRGVDADSYIWNTSFARATDRYGELPTRYKERLNREFQEIVEAGLANAVVSLIRLHEELEHDGVQRGPGAGLFTNSVIASLMGLTRLDPLKFDLPFSLPAGLGKGSFPLLELSIPANQEAAAVGALQRLFEGQALAVGEWRPWKTSHALERAAELLGHDGKWAASTARSDAFQRAREEAASQPATWTPDADEPIESYAALAWLVHRMEGRARELVAAPGVYTFSVEPMETMVPRRLVSDAHDAPLVALSEWTSEELGRLRHGRLAYVHSPLLDLIGESTELARQQGDSAFSPDQTPPDDAATYRLLREGRTLGIPPLESPAIRRRLRVGQPADLHSLIAILKQEGPDIAGDDLPDFASILLCHVCAAIKAHRPLAFQAAALGQAAGDSRRTAALLEEMRSRLVRIAEIDINFSQWRWSVEGDAIRPGLLAIRGLSAAAAAEIAEKRRELQFGNLSDLCHRTDKSRLRPAHLRLLLRAGAFDHLGATRAELAGQLEELFPILKARRGGAPPTEDELSFFDRDGAWWLRENARPEDAATQPLDLAAEQASACGVVIGDFSPVAISHFLREARVQHPTRMPLKMDGHIVCIDGVPSGAEVDRERPGAVIADVGGVLVRASGELGLRLASEELGARRVLLTGKISRDSFQWELELESLVPLDEAMERAARVGSISLDLSQIPAENHRKLLQLLRQFPGATPLSMEWIPLEPARLFRAIASSTVLACPLMDSGLDRIAGASHWRMTTEAPLIGRNAEHRVRAFSRRLGLLARRKIAGMMGG